MERWFVCLFLRPSRAAFYSLVAWRISTRGTSGWSSASCSGAGLPGVSVVVAEADGRRAGLTVSSLVSLSLEPPLVAISLAHVASLYEVLQEAGEWTASILSGEQDHIAQHFARSVPPLVLWDGIAVREDDPRLIADAVGWLRVRTVDEVRTGDHTLFVGEVLHLERGSKRDARSSTSTGTTRRCDRRPSSSTWTAC